MSITKTDTAADSAAASGVMVRRRPRVGFLGLGWIGRNRLEALVESGTVEVAGLSDAWAASAKSAQEVAPGAKLAESFEQLLEMDLDGVVIATPSALHVEQCLKAIHRGVPVFCQKPLGRTAAEAQQVVEAAKRNDVLLGVDLSYREMSGTRAVRQLCQSGNLGQVYAADLVFHNAYGPDKDWFYDWRRSGGGCVIDLGVHLVDLGLWVLGFPGVQGASSRLYAQGKPLTTRDGAVEDFCEARLDLRNGASLRVACSWKLSAGCEAVISGTFYGTQGAARFTNVNGSFYEFRAESLNGTRSEVLCSGAEAWGGRAAVSWARQLALNPQFDPEAEHLVTVASALDAIYDSATVR